MRLRDFNGHKRLVASRRPDGGKEEVMAQNTGPMDLVGNVAELPADVAAYIRGIVKASLVGVINVGETGVGGAARTGLTATAGLAATAREGLETIDGLIAQIEAEYRKVVEAAKGEG
jgi:hypothetical protein